jgi:hypothetical protein
MIQYQQSDKGLGLNEMLNTLITRTWKAPKKTGIQELIQQQTGQLLLTYLLAASVDDNLSFPAKSMVQQCLSDLKKYIEAQQKIVKDDLQLANYILAVERMKAPEKAKPTIHLPSPPGAPIGCDLD